MYSVEHRIFYIYNNTGHEGFDGAGYRGLYEQGIKNGIWRG